MSACAAIAMASSAKARKVHSVIASWWAARSASPPVCVAPYVVTSSAARSVRVRITSATAAWAAVRMPGRSGPSAAPSARAPRATTTSRKTAAATWASTEPIAEPRSPSSGNGPTP